MSVVITIDERMFAGRSPHWQHQHCLQMAADAVMFDDEGIDQQAALALAGAAIGLCWDDAPLGCKPLHKLRHDVVAYGTGVNTALFELGITDQQAIWDEGIRLIKELRGLTVTQEDVEDAADPTEAQPAHSTGPM